MAKYSIEKTTLTNIANPLRSLRGLTGGMTPEEMANNANAVQINVTKALAATAAKGVTVPADANSDDLESLILAIENGTASGGGREPVIAKLNVTENGTYNAPVGVDGFAPVNVNVGGGGIKTCDVKIVFDFDIPNTYEGTEIDAYYPQLVDGAITPYNYTNIWTPSGKPSDLNISSCPVGQTVVLDVFGYIGSWGGYTVDASEAIELTYCGGSTSTMLLWIPPTAQGEFVITISEYSEEEPDDPDSGDTTTSELGIAKLGEMKLA